MFSNFVIILLVFLVVLYVVRYFEKNEFFGNYDSNIYESIGSGIVPSKMLYFSPQNNSISDIDYQDYLNEVSGYDSGTRGYNNLNYAVDVAAGLDTN